jgi:transcriptional regulator with XRE-family HTH domain
MHHSRLARLESGEIGDRLTPEFLQGIADVLDLDVSKLLKFVGVTPRPELPSVHVYFRRKFGIDADEADVLAELVNEYQRAQSRTTQVKRGGTP